MSMKVAKRGVPAMVSVALALTVLTGLGAGAADPGPAIERGYSTALASALPLSPAAASEVGSEAFWLGQPFKGREAEAKVEAASWQAPVAKGEQIIVGEGRMARTLEVVSVEPMPEQTTRIDTATGVRGLLITARDTADPDGLPIRFRIAIAPETATDAAHAL